MSPERPRPNSKRMSLDAWFVRANELPNSSIELEAAFQDHLREGYRLFFKAIRSQSGIQAEIPSGIADFAKPLGPRTVTFSSGDSRIIQGRNGIRLYSSNEWQVTVCGYKKNGLADNREYYKNHTDEQAVVILHPFGREFDRFVFNLQFSLPKRPNQPFNSNGRGSMQIEVRNKVYGTMATGGKLKLGENNLLQMTELDVLMLVNSLGQIFAEDSSVEKAHPPSVD